MHLKTVAAGAAFIATLLAFHLSAQCATLTGDTILETDPSAPAR
jgi:hypothetical protein